jgi:predicted secreted hydrolase
MRQHTVDMLRGWLLLAALACMPLLSPAQTDAEGFQLAMPGYAFQFPRDHGSHPDFKTEWWYFTGNLHDESGGRHGYELTFFRTALLSPAAREGRGPLVADQLHFAHFGISGGARRTHAAEERGGRVGLGQARASEETLDLMCGGWTARLDGEEMLIKASADFGEVELRLVPTKPVVMHGENGAHAKGPEPGQASHYLSFTRLETTGTLTIDGVAKKVSGLSWMDHEFGSSWLGPDEVGWDWFSIQLNAGEELMIYGIRRRDGTWSPTAQGTIVGADGSVERLSPADYSVSSKRVWRSGKTGAEYPIGWVIELPRHGGRLDVEPLFDEQEMVLEGITGSVYWEGAVNVTGSWRGAAAKGAGYVELVGYGKEFAALKAP